MAEIKGLGLCGICMKDIQDEKTGTASPIRHFQGHQLAHKSCFDALEARKKTPEYQIDLAQQELIKADRSFRVAETNLAVAKQRLRDLGVDPEI